MTKDYRSTVFLPNTNFPMRGGLPTKEPELLAHWRQLDVYGLQRKQAKQEKREKFVLHDGPPYANGNIHIGHAVNKILKDVVVRSQQMLGLDADYVPGWDCHGLPIEWKIEEKYRAAGKDKDQVPVLQFRAECRDFAAEWKDIQSGEFQRLGVVGNWANPYTTMTKAAEAQIVREIHKFLENGGLYQGVKPVMWSVVEKTALAEAEVEYHDVTSTTAWVKFKVRKSNIAALVGNFIVIWTTTPWTLPGNRAIAYGKDINYSLCRIEDAGEHFQQEILVASDLVGTVESSCGIRLTPLQQISGKDLAGTIASHPLAGQGYDYDVPLFAGDFVTTETGTSLVHIAPGHGADDFELGRRHNIEVPRTVDDDGSYYANVPLFAGKRVYTPHGKSGDANPAVLEAIKAAGGLLAQGKLTHSYPHSWRSKAPLIFRTTPQWFISMETNKLREKALDAIKETTWIPAMGQNRIEAMIESRPDWCISRQRAWGVPIALFLSKTDGQPLKDEAVLKRIADAFEEDGADAWYARDPQEFLGDAYNKADYDQVFDIVDVWFESGSTHAFVLEARPDELRSPADLYLEGSDQHRGWFHSSLLESCGTRGRAPYKTVLTHGFVLDEQGRKMSKSLGNVVAPQKVNDEYGADILRLWVLNSDYSEDMRVGPEILKSQADLYRRLRNTLRYLLGALDGFDPAKERVAYGELPELERWVLHRLTEIDAVVRTGIAAYDFHRIFTALHTFCTVDLSAFYFDVRKDSLYCDRPNDPTRRAVRTVMEQLFSCLTAWLAPLLCFTAEEAWLAYRAAALPAIRDKMPESVHLHHFPTVHAAWSNLALAVRWEKVRGVRRVVTGALEQGRAAKQFGSSLQAHPFVYVTPDHQEALAGLDLADIAITSDLMLKVGEAPADAFRLDDVSGVGVVVKLAEGQKCERCWKVLPEVGQDHEHSDLCRRCADAVGNQVEAAE